MSFFYSLSICNWKKQYNTSCNWTQKNKIKLKMVLYIQCLTLMYARFRHLKWLKLWSWYMHIIHCVH